MALFVVLLAGCQDIVDINDPRVITTTPSPYIALGIPDTTFGGDVYPAPDSIPDGYVVHDGAGGVAQNQAGNDVVATSAGLIYVAGSAWNGTDFDLALWRFTSAGALDTTFGAPNGYVTHSGAAGGVFGDDQGLAIAVDSSGRIVVAGYSVNVTPTTDMTVWRFNTDGTLDTLNFGAPNGYYVHANAAIGTVGSDLAITGTGKIVVVGTSTNAGDTDAAIWRLNADGTLDTTFGDAADGDLLLASIQGTVGMDTANAVVLDSSGRILITGKSVGASATADMTVLRVLADGSALDATFGADVNPADLTPDGYIAHHNAASGAGADVGNAIALDSAGRILVTGTSVGSGANDDMVLWRLLADGSALDSAFGEDVNPADLTPDGFVFRDNISGGGSGADAGNAVALDGNGNIFVAGSSFNGVDASIVLWRFTSAGATDTTFGLDVFPQPTPDGIDDGFLMADSLAGGAGADIAHGMRLDSDGKILVVGESPNATNQDMVLLRIK